MQFTLDQLQAFITTVEQGSFSAAARHLGKAQSAVSTAIANLELDLDITLFDRTGRSPKLTEPGKELLEKAYSLIEQKQAFLQTAQSLHAGTEAKLKLAIDENLMGDNLVKALKTLAETYPHTRLDILTPTGEEAWSMLSQHQIDLALMISPVIQPPRFVKIQPCGWLRYTAVAAPDHPLAKASSMDIEELRRHRQLLIRGQQEQVSSATHLSHQVWALDSTHVLWELLYAGMGWATVARHLVQRDLEQGTLVELGDTSIHEHFYLPVDLACHVSFVPGIVAQHLLTTLPALKLFSEQKA